MPKVMIHPAGYDNVRQAVDRAFELFPVEVTGRKVLIKPNVLRLSALSMNGDTPLVDAETCITCFCCQEICPEKAITLK